MIYHFEASVLYDFYSTLLTDKQKDAIDLYYNDDLTMTEIADNLGVSKQAVSNLIKSANEKLQAFEEDLHLADMFYKSQKIKEDLISLHEKGKKTEGFPEDILLEIENIIDEFKSIERWNMFESLSERIQSSLAKITGKGKLSEKDVDMVMREVKMALLEADVNFKVVKDFTKTVKERCVGKEVMESLTPAQQVIKIVNEELTALMGGKEEKIDFSKKPTIILMCGLQGAGKTTTSAKLAGLMKKEGKNPMLVGVDIYRPAAIKQLQVVGEKVKVPVFEKGTQVPAKTAKEAVEYAKQNNHDVIIIDTAGRLHIDEDLMNELRDIKSAVDVSEILLVLDSMTGQDAVNVAKSFNDTLELTGVVLTKLDGDARGGAALSIRSVVDKPIKFITTGEKLDKIESFKPDRLASRILGMGDVLTLIEKAEAAYDEKKAKELEQKMREMTFTLDDFLDQMEQVRKMGPINELLGMLPGVGNNKALKNIQVDEKQMARIEAIIKSMTKEERYKPEIIDQSRKDRIASGAGVKSNEVSKLLKQFKDTKKMMKKFNQMSKKSKGRMGMPFF